MGNYFKNQIFSYKDLSTGEYLDVCIDTSSSSDNYRLGFNTTQICFSIYDSRLNKTMSKISMCLRYQNVMKLSNNISMLNMNTVFDTGCTINITQYNHKSKKELVLTFGYNTNKERLIQLSIIDNTTQRGNATINLDIQSFLSISSILKNFSNNYLKTDIGIKQLFINCKILDRLNELNNLEQPTKIIKEYNNDVNDINDNEDDAIDLDEYKDEPTEPSDIQQDFLDVCKKTDMFSNVDLDMDIKIDKPAKINKVDKQFIGSFLNYDLTKLNEWATSFICLTEKTDSHSFSPFDIIMNIGHINYNDRKKYTNDFGYYPMQYGLLYLLKTIVKNAIVTGDYPKNVPAIKFGNTISKGTDLYKLAQEILVVFLIYSFVVNNYVNFKNIDHMKLDNIKRSYYTIKLLFSPFLFSLEIEDNFTDELLHLFNACMESGAFNKLQEEYSKLTNGGNMNFGTDMFEKYCTRFLNVFKNSAVDTFDTENNVKNTFKKYNIPYPIENINNAEDIRKILFKVETNNKRENEIEQNVNIEHIEPRLEFFLTVSDGYLEKNIANEVKKSCKKFADLRKFFNKFDIPPEIFKIMRAIEIDSKATTKREILKTAKLLNEDEDVTKSSGLQEETIIEDQIDIQNFLTNTNIF